VRRVCDEMRKRHYFKGTPYGRLLGRIEIDEAGCWIWQGAKVTSGYGHINIGGDKYSHAHIVSYEHHFGPVPEGKELDHRCRVRACVNPFHLEPVTHVENCLRGEAPNIKLHRAGVCQNGHPRSEACLRKGTNKVVYCRACRREKRMAIKNKRGSFHEASY